MNADAQHHSVDRAHPLAERPCRSRRRSAAFEPTVDRTLDRPATRTPAREVPNIGIKHEAKEPTSAIKQGCAVETARPEEDSGWSFLSYRGCGERRCVRGRNRWPDNEPPKGI